MSESLRFVPSEETDVSDDADALEASANPIRRFVVRTSDRAVIVRAGDVDWIEAARNYVLLHVKDRQYRLRITLQSLQERLDEGQFRRIHKSVIVNLDRIKEIQPWFGGDHMVVLHDGKQLRVSRTYARALLRPIQ
jgi:two-component system, LytTR family, response regulator